MDLDFMKLALEYIKVELLMLVFVLWAIGTQLKKSKQIADWKIPFVLMLISVTFALSYVLITSGINPMAVWVGIMQGLVIWAVEGQIYQSYKQAKEKR